LFKLIQSLTSSAGFVKYFKNTSWLLVEKVFRIFAGLFVGVWIARYLGPEQYGVLSYSLSLVALFAGLATLGLDNIVVRELVQNVDKKNEIIGTAFFLKLAGAIIAFVLIILVSLLIAGNDLETIVLIVILASSLLFQCWYVVDLYCQSQVQSRYVAVAKILSLVLSSSVKIILILVNAPVVAFALVVLFEIFVISMCFVLIYVKATGNDIFAWHFEIPLAISLLKQSWPLLLSSIMVVIYLKIDQIMIKEILGMEAVGQYAAAVRISEAIYFVPTIIANSLFPAIINAKNNSGELYFERLQKLFTLMLWIAIVLILPLALFSEYIVDTLYGDVYTDAVNVLRIHLWAGVFVFLGVGSAKYLIAERMQIHSFLRNLSGMLINVLLNIILIKDFGIEGAAYATFFSYFFAGFLYDMVNKKMRLIFIMKLRALLFWKLGSQKSYH